MRISQSLENKYLYPSLAELNEAFDILPEMEMSAKGLKNLYASISALAEFSEEEKRQGLASVRQRYVEIKEKIDMLTGDTKGKRQKYDIERLRQIPISRFVDVPRNGKILCPLHQERTPSMSIKGNLFHCFGCGESGDTITFIQKTMGLNFRQALQFLEGEGK